MSNMEMDRFRTYAPVWFSILVIGVCGALALNQSNDVRGQVFPDLEAGSRIEDAAALLRDRGVIEGFPDGTFKPNQTINRAQAAKMLLLGSEKNATTDHITIFATDLQEGAWYTDYIAIANNLGIMQGYGNGEFRPGGTIIRSEFFKMLSIAFSLQVNRRSSYPDVPDGTWYAPFASVAETYELMADDRQILFNPSQKVTRGEAAYAIAKAIRLLHPELPQATTIQP